MMTRDRQVWFHWQNLNEKPGGRTGSPLRNGRAWLHAWSAVIGWEWVLGGLRAAVGFNAHQGDGIGVQFSIGFPLIGSLFLTLDGGPFKRFAKALLPRKGYEDRELSLRVFDWSIWWEVWRDGRSWSSKTPKWRSGVLHPLDVIFGKQQPAKRVLLGPVDVMIPMPERSYAGKVTLVERSLKRPRWFARRFYTADIDMAEGEQIPKPGKGESEWDCGEDATFGLGCPALTVEEAIGAMVESVMRDRRRHGGSVMWKPAVKKEKALR